MKLKQQRNTKLVTDLINLVLRVSMVTRSTNNEVGPMKWLKRYHKHLSFTCIVTNSQNIRNLIHLLPHPHAWSLTNSMFYGNKKMEWKMKLFYYLFLNLFYLFIWKQKTSMIITSHEPHSSTGDYLTSIKCGPDPGSCAL